MNRARTQFTHDSTDSTDTMTTVTNLKTGKTQVYSCDAAHAVTCAYEQSRGNWNTWTYGETLAAVKTAGKQVYCGDFAAPCKPRD